ncbi:MAG: hypothetical protein ACRDJ2_15670 [Actinomycetota bacterium]
MTAFHAVDDLVEQLKTIPASVVPHARIGSIVPHRTQDLPAIAVVLQDAQESSLGFGGLVGLSQTAEEEWTEATGSLTKGTLRVELFAESAADATSVGSAVATALDPVQARSRGFVGFSVNSIGPIQEIGLGHNGSQSAFSRAIDISIVHERISSATTGPGGLIRTVHVDMHEEPQPERDDEFHEEMDVTE